MDPIIPINPYPSKRSRKSEFWTELGELFIGGGDDLVGIVLSILLAIGFIFKWGFYLLCKVFRINIKKPAVKRK